MSHTHGREAFAASSVLFGALVATPQRDAIDQAHDGRLWMLQDQLPVEEPRPARQALVSLVLATLLTTFAIFAGGMLGEAARPAGAATAAAAAITCANAANEMPAACSVQTR